MIKLLNLTAAFLALSFSCTPAMEEERKGDWDTIIAVRVPQGRAQLETYKEIYGAHVEQHGEGKERFKNHVEGLDIPLKWAYTNAFRRLKGLEETNPGVTEKLGQTPTAALKQLYLEHVQDTSKPLSVSKFQNYVFDVVELMDLYFHYGESHLWKKDLEQIFSKKNEGSTIIFFSPVFLQKQGLSVKSINFAFFGKGPFLAAVEVGPNRNAHQKLFSQTNRRFIQNHDLFHARDTLRFLKTDRPELFSALQAFHDKIETLPEEGSTETQALGAKQDFLHMGLFLLGHEYVSQLFTSCFTTYSENANPTLNDFVKEGIAYVKSLLKYSYTEGENNYVVLYKDALDSIAQVMEKNALEEKEKEFYRGVQNRFVYKNIHTLEPKTLENLLNKFEEKFLKAATPLIHAIEKEQSENKKTL